MDKPSPNVSALKSRRAVIGYIILFILNSRFWRGVELVGDMQAIGDVFGWVAGAMSAALPWIRDWGWLLGLIWLAWLVFRKSEIGGKDPTALAVAETMTTAEANRRQRDRERTAAPNTPPTATESVAIDDLRVLYGSAAKNVSIQAAKLLDDVQASIRGKNPLSPLLEPDIDAHTHARDKLNTVLGDRSKAAIKTVVGCFGEFFRQYMRTVRLMHLAAGDSSFNPHSFEGYLEWERGHNDFRIEATRMLRRADLASLRMKFQEITWQKRFADDGFGGLAQPDVPSGQEY